MEGFRPARRRGKARTRTRTRTRAPATSTPRRRSATSRSADRTPPGPSESSPCASESRRSRSPSNANPEQRLASPPPLLPQSRRSAREAQPWSLEDRKRGSARRSTAANLSCVLVSLGHAFPQEASSKDPRCSGPRQTGHRPGRDGCIYLYVHASTPIQDGNLRQSRAGNRLAERLPNRRGRADLRKAAVRAPAIVQRAGAR